jgi:hypothetical protein
MYRIRLRLKNGAHIETGPRPGATPKLGSPIELSYQGGLYRARVTNVASMKRQPPRLEAVDLVDAEEL